MSDEEVSGVPNMIRVQNLDPIPEQENEDEISENNENENVDENENEAETETVKNERSFYKPEKSSGQGYEVSYYKPLTINQEAMIVALQKRAYRDNVYETESEGEESQANVENILSVSTISKKVKKTAEKDKDIEAQIEEYDSDNASSAKSVQLEEQTKITPKKVLEREKKVIQHKKPIKHKKAKTRKPKISSTVIEFINPTTFKTETQKITKQNKTIKKK